MDHPQFTMNPPLGPQKHPVMVGRCKGGDIIIQVDGKAVTIPVELVSDTVKAILVCKE